jgi:hypothetical protein
MNGLVTTPTVSAPTSRATRASTGAPPVPVPPPIPAVMKIMSEPSRYSLNHFLVFQRGTPADLRIGSRAQAFGYRATQFECAPAPGSHPMIARRCSPP